MTDDIDQKVFDNIITPARLRRLKFYIKKWQAKLGLKGWRIAVIRGKKSMVGTNQAVLKIFLDDRLVRFYVGDNCGNEDCTEHVLETLVVHEFLHVLLYSMKAFAADLGEVQHVDVLGAEHEAINILEGLLCPPPEEVHDGSTEGATKAD